ncbi:group III truncated hemoglobin [Devosia rhizoryzae]|uniref:Group III truncated hemoglobin n=1 Tax=Devosia rhizoryzae TaxID=2774137 RepID=A0ABX7CDX9_9HYPH|nr:group III truncated hemoglobin [Devosia rhizoryzae]QQR41022.1 group III truncated hemoglobin [Devosia rhizoryzae]
MTDTDRPPVGTQHVRVGWNTPEGLDEAMIRAVVDEFYARARLDDVIGPVFNRVIAGPDWPKHLATIADFWSSMLLGSGRYGGRPMPKHMAIPELSDAHFMRWLRLFRETVTELCPPEIAAIFIERSERVGNSFRMNIAMRRGEDIMTMGPLKREPAPVWTPDD